MSLTTPYLESYLTANGVDITFGFSFDAISENYVRCLVYMPDGAVITPNFTVDLAAGEVSIVSMTTPDGELLQVPPEGATVRIYRDAPESQDATASVLQAFTSKQLEKSLDKIVATVQQVDYKATHKTVRTTETERDVWLDKLTAEHDDELLKWDESGHKITTSGLTEQEIRNTTAQATTIANEAKAIATEARTTANEAKSTSNDAKAIAQNAATDAENAVQTATEAANVANAADAKAESAKTTATNANTKADAAVSTANSALQKANTAMAQSSDALAEAAVSLEKSEQAVATANEAKEIATEARTTANEASSAAAVALSNSQQAVSTANSASAKADESLSASARAESKSDNAVATAGRAESSAAQAVSTSNQALENSEQALADVQSAVDAAQRATEAAEAAEQAVQEYDGRIQQAQDDATSALSQVGNKQDTLVSGTNIKTVNNQSILGSGNIEIKGGVESVNTKTGVVVLTGEDISADVSELTDTVQGHLQTLHDNIKDIELFKFPNATIIGEPIIDHGQVSGFSESSYLQFPFIVDLHNQPFQIDFCFTTGNDVTTQQNILDSQFGLALAIANGRGLMAISHNGTSWAGSVTGTMAIQPNTTYYARLSWNRINYQTQLSTDGTTYTPDMNFGSTQSPYPRTMFIGGCSGSAIGHSAHPFGGTINMNYAYLTVAGNVIWQGMDDAGLSTRANVSLDNLDELGQAKFDAKQNKLVAGTGITIENDVISSTGGTVVIMRDL